MKYFVQLAGIKIKTVRLLTRKNTVKNLTYLRIVKDTVDIVEKVRTTFHF